MEKSFRSPGGLPLPPGVEGAVGRGGEAIGTETRGAVTAAADRRLPLAPRLRAACWGCLVGIFIGLALSELWPS